jgi:hypothetical protein
MQGLERAGVQAEITPARQGAPRDGYSFVISLVSITSEEAPPSFGKTYIRGDFSVGFVRDGLTLKFAAAAFNDTSRDWVLRGAANWIRDNREFYEEVSEKLTR